MNRADRENLFKTQLRKFQRIRLLAMRVHLVHRHKNRFAAAAQSLRHLAVQRNDSLLHIHHQHNYLRSFDRQIGLL